MDTMHIYNQFREVPKEAQKTIQAGKLKGFTDINPMWRIKMLTEQFGMCGEGWKTAEVNMWTERAAEETAAFCTLNLYVKVEGKWSDPIFGIGGSKLSGKGVGDGINDEAFKMAYTDALSIACKNLGMAADIYFANDRTKYNAQVEQPSQPSQAVQARRAAKKNSPVSTSYTPVDLETYWKMVKAESNGVLCPSGKTAKERWVEMTHAGVAEILKFDTDVKNLKFSAPAEETRRTPIQDI